MLHTSKLKVLVVDDSMLYQEIIRRGLSSDPNIEVVAMAKDPFEARDQILRYQPDVMTCDIEMPRMNGIEFIRRLLPQHPLPTIVVSTVSEAVLDVLRAGAVDFVVKPDPSSVQHVERFIGSLISKVKAAAHAKVPTLNSSASRQEMSGAAVRENDKIIVVGSSTGGTEAIVQLLSALPPGSPGFVIVQHIPPVFSGMYADRLNKLTPFRSRKPRAVILWSGGEC